MRCHRRPVDVRGTCFAALDVWSRSPDIHQRHSPSRALATIVDWRSIFLERKEITSSIPIPDCHNSTDIRNTKIVVDLIQVTLIVSIIIIIIISILLLTLLLCCPLSGSPSSASWAWSSSTIDETTFDSTQHKLQLSSEATWRCRWRKRTCSGITGLWNACDS